MLVATSGRKALNEEDAHSVHSLDARQRHRRIAANKIRREE